MRCLHETRRLGIVIERTPDFAHAHLQRAVGHEHAGPDRIEQLVLRDEASRACHEVLEKRERLGRQRDRSVTVEQTPGAGIELEVFEGEPMVLPGVHGASGSDGWEANTN